MYWPQSKYILILAFIILAANSFSKNFPLLHYTVENGLPSNTVYDLYRDSKGFIWLSTDKGIVKYNGIEFEKYTTNDGLPDNEIFFFKEDYENRVWMSCYNGQLCFYKDGILHTGANTPYLKKLPVENSFPIKMNIEEDSSMTITFNNFLFFFNVKKDRVHVIYTNANLPSIINAKNQQLLVQKISE